MSKDEGKTHALHPYIYTDSIVSETLLQNEKLWNYLENYSFSLNLVHRLQIYKPKYKWLR